MAPPTVAVNQTAAHLAGVAFDDGYNGGGGTANGRPVYYHGDQIGTTHRMTGTDASVNGPGTNGGGGPDPTPPTLARSTYSAFGEPIARVQMGGPGSGPVSFRYGYAGAHGYQYGNATVLDDGEPVVVDPIAALGWLHVGERYYDPSAGRFTMRDPLGPGGGINTYEYCSNRPTMGVDPKGTDFWDGSNGFHEWIAIHVWGAVHDTETLARMGNGRAYAEAIGVSIIAGCGIYFGGAALLGGSAEAGSAAVGTEAGSVAIGGTGAEVASVTAEIATGNAYRGGIKLTTTLIEEGTGRQIVRDTIIRGGKILHEHWKCAPPWPPLPPFLQ